MNRALNTDEVAEPNAFAIEATVAAFREGEAWLDELREYIQENKKYVNDFLKKELPELKSVPLEATYLLWIDCSNILENATELSKILRETTGLYLSAGNQYGGNGGQFLRMNIACPREVLKDGLKRLKRGISYILSK